MNSKDLDNLLNIKKIEEKIFKFKTMYHPNLIANLSKEAYDLYLIRNSICEKLFKLTEKKDPKIHEIKEFIKKEIDDNNKKIKKSKDHQEISFLKLAIQEWKEFL
jgi:hypothetical protein